MLVRVFLLLSRTLWDRHIATSSRYNWQSALDSIYYIAANHAMVFMNIHY